MVSLVLSLPSDGKYVVKISPVHQSPRAEVSQQKGVEVLPHQRRNAAPRMGSGPSQTSLQFAQGGLDGPSLGVEVGQLDRRSLPRLENGAEQPVLLALASEAVLDQSRFDPGTISGSRIR